MIHDEHALRRRMPGMTSRAPAALPSMPQTEANRRAASAEALFGRKHGVGAYECR